MIFIYKVTHFSSAFNRLNYVLLLHYLGCVRVVFLLSSQLCMYSFQCITIPPSINQKTSHLHLFKCNTKLVRPRFQSQGQRKNELTTGEVVMVMQPCKGGVCMMSTWLLLFVNWRRGRAGALWNWFSHAFVAYNALHFDCLKQLYGKKV